MLKAMAIRAQHYAIGDGMQPSLGLEFSVMGVAPTCIPPATLALVSVMPNNGFRPTMPSLVTMFSVKDGVALTFVP